MADTSNDPMDPTDVKRPSWTPGTTGAHGDKLAGSEGIDDSDRAQGSENTDGNGADFDGQGAQKEAGTERGEGTGYTNE